MATVFIETTRNVVVVDESGIPTVVVTAVGVQGPRGLKGDDGNLEALTPLQAQLALNIYVLGLNDSEAGLPVGAIIIRKSVP